MLVYAECGGAMYAARGIEDLEGSQHEMAGLWPATVSGNAYASVSAINSGGDIYPNNFQPAPGRFSLQVTTGDSTAPSEAEKSAQTEKAEESPQPAESPKPTTTPSNPFAGAESTPG